MFCGDPSLIYVQKGVGGGEGREGGKRAVLLNEYSHRNCTPRISVACVAVCEK